MPQKCRCGFDGEIAEIVIKSRLHCTVLSERSDYSVVEPVNEDQVLRFSYLQRFHVISRFKSDVKS